MGSGEDNDGEDGGGRYLVEDYMSTAKKRSRKASPNRTAAASSS